LIAWSIARDIAVRDFLKSVNEGRIKENLEASNVNSLMIDDMMEL